MKKLNKYPIVECFWLDAHGSDDWLTKEEFQMKPVKTRTCGMLVGENELGIMITATVNSSGQFGSCWFIPHQAVVEIKYYDN